MKKELFTIVFVSMLVLASRVGVAEEEQGVEDVFNLGEIVVTPSRLYQEYGQVSRATNLITEEEIEGKNPLRVGDLLEDLPSALVQENGSLGQSSSIRFRGASSSQSLVLIDGMPLNNPRDGG